MPFDEVHPAQRAGPGVADTPSRPASVRQTRVLGIGLLVLAAVLGYLFLVVINADTAGPATARQQVCVAGDFLCFGLSLDARLLVLVMLAGALGSLIHATTSFGDFVGNHLLTANWLWWYVLKPVIGTVLATVFYLVVRAGFLMGLPDTGSINLYGIVALAAMVGMFSKQATDKLGEVFDTLFRTQPGGGDQRRREGLANPMPVLSGSTPTRLPPGARDLTIVLNGKGFVESSVVHVNGGARPTSFTDSTRLSATLLDSDVVRESQLDVTVVNPAPGGGTSEPLALAVASVAFMPALASTLASAMAATPDAEEAIDGCDIKITVPTPDEELPVAHGGVTS